MEGGTTGQILQGGGAARQRLTAGAIQGRQESLSAGRALEGPPTISRPPQRHDLRAGHRFVENIGPHLHEPAPLLQRVVAAVGLLHLVADLMHQGSLCDLVGAGFRLGAADLSDFVAGRNEAMIC